MLVSQTVCLIQDTQILISVLSLKFTIPANQLAHLTIIRQYGLNMDNMDNMDNIGLKHVTRLRFGLSHLRDRKFKHSFLGSLNPFCS